MESEQNGARGPLSDLRLIEMGTLLAGPFCGQLMADFGAEVIKVENPDGGDYVRKGANRQGDFSAGFLNNNRNKKAVAINLKSERGKDLFLRLA